MAATLGCGGYVVGTVVTGSLRSFPTKRVFPCKSLPLRNGFWTLHNRNPLSTFSITALPFDLSPPPIDHDLLDTLAVAGANLSGSRTVETFHNDDEALDAVDNGVAGKFRKPRPCQEA